MKFKTVVYRQIAGDVSSIEHDASCHVSDGCLIVESNECRGDGLSHAVWFYPAGHWIAAKRVFE